ncbi:MAG TPA: hypothetical protein VIA98_03180 [Allosphingosinicella sp.]|jgi:hypothetical protein
MTRRFLFFPADAPALGPPSPLPTWERLEQALTASWDARTAHLGACADGNPALGQCYPTARVVQWFFPRFEIASGEVDTGAGLEWHFWNVDPASDPPEVMDLTWRQFPEGSKVTRLALLDRAALGDSVPTLMRCQLLLDRVLLHLAG